MKRKRPKPPTSPTVGVVPKFERTLVELCREMGYHRRYTPVEIDRIICSITTEDFAGTLEELGTLIEREDWDALVQLAARERTRRMIRGVA
jgi:hypothetical protein